MAETQKAQIFVGTGRVEGVMNPKEYCQLVVNGELITESTYDTMLPPQIHRVGKIMATRLQEMGITDFEIINGKRYNSENGEFVNVDEFNQLELMAFRVGIKLGGNLRI